MKPEWVPKMAPANTFKKTEPGTAKVWEKSGHGLMIRLWSKRELPTNLFEEVGWREEQENVLRMKLMIDSKHSSQATNVLEAWGEIQETSLRAKFVYYSISKCWSNTSPGAFFTTTYRKARFTVMAEGTRANLAQVILQVRPQVIILNLPTQLVVSQLVYVSDTTLLVCGLSK